MTKCSAKKKLGAVEAHEARGGGLGATAETHAVGVDSLEVARGVRRS